MLQEQLAAARQQLAAAESRISGAARELSGLGPLQQRCEELAEQGGTGGAAGGGGGAGSGGVEAEARRREQLRDAEAKEEAASKALKAVEAARDRTLTESRLTVTVASSSAEEAGSTVRHMAARLAAAEAAAAAAARGREQESRAQGREWVERARRVEALVAELEADVARAINWTSREDGLLLLGVHQHRMGHWDKVAVDEARSADRSLADKLAGEGRREDASEAVREEEAAACMWWCV
ncbi:hypothetical protein PLESTM_001084500 [Pleodorina starrii]|nr:hypothetical protein PLESTM_001084500 [Pleodorina starrii]